MTINVNNAQIVAIAFFAYLFALKQEAKKNK